MATIPTARTPILVVEDDGDIREALRDLLTDEGYGVTLATSPDEAIALCDRQAFACILMDLFRHLAHVQDPMASARALLTSVAPTPVLLVTAWPLDPEE